MPIDITFGALFVSTRTRTADLTSSSIERFFTHRTVLPFPVFVEGKVFFDSHSLKILRTVVVLDTVFVVYAITPCRKKSGLPPHHKLMLKAVDFIPLTTRPVVRS